MALLGSVSVLAFACLLVVGCGRASNLSSDGAAGGAAGGSDAGDVGGAGGAGGSPSDVDADVEAAPVGPCEAIENGALPVDEVQVAAALPVGVAGGLTPGTYFLTEAKRYTGPGGASGPSGKTRQETLILKGNGLNVFIGDDAQSRDGAPAVMRTHYWSFSSTDSKVQLLQSCPAPMSTVTVTFSFDDATGKLTVFGGFTEAREVSIFTKQTNQ